MQGNRIVKAFIYIIMYDSSVSCMTASVKGLLSNMMGSRAVSSGLKAEAGEGGEVSAGWCGSLFPLSFGFVLIAEELGERKGEQRIISTVY